MINQPAAQTDLPESVEYVGFSSRMGALLVDCAILLAPVSLVFSALFSAIFGADDTKQRVQQMVLHTQDNKLAAQTMMQMFLDPAHFDRWLTENILGTLVIAIAVTVCWHYLSATPGKWLMGQKIVDAKTGYPPTKKQDILRFAGYFISVTPMLLGFFWMSWDSRKQGWHDKIAGTVVVVRKTLPEHLRYLTAAKEAKRVHTAL